MRSRRVNSSPALVLPNTVLTTVELSASFHLARDVGSRVKTVTPHTSWKPVRHEHPSVCGWRFLFRCSFNRGLSTTTTPLLCREIPSCPPQNGIEHQLNLGRWKRSDWAERKRPPFFCNGSVTVYEWTVPSPHSNSNLLKFLVLKERTDERVAKFSSSEMECKESNR